MICRKETVKDILASIESAFDEGRLDQLRAEIERGLEVFPGNPTLIEWQAVLAFEEGRLGDALRALEEVLAHEPDRRFALREKASVLHELGRFEDAMEILLKIGPDGDRDASYYFQLGVCQDRAGLQSEALANLERASEIDPRDHRIPLRMERGKFEQLVAGALAGEIPDRVRERLPEIEIAVEDYPHPIDPSPFAYSLYQAALRPAEATGTPNLRDRLVLYQRNLEIDFPDEEQLLEEIARTVVFEISHQFGFEDDPMLGMG